MQKPRGAAIVAPFQMKIPTPPCERGRSARRALSVKWRQITVPHPSTLGPCATAHFPGFLLLLLIVLRCAAARFVEDAAPSRIEPVDPATHDTQFAAGLPLKGE